MVGAPSKRKVVRHLQSSYQVSERRACQVLGFARSVARYKSMKPPQDALRARIRDLAENRVRYGYRRIHILLRREGMKVNKKRVHRLYCEEGLQLRAKRPRRNVSCAHRQQPKQLSTAPNESWAMDFMSDQLVNGRKIRIFTVVDTFTRECLAVAPGNRMTSSDVVNVLDKISRARGNPKRIHCDNGPEFTGCVTDLWAYKSKVTLAYSRPGKPTDNAFIESFNGSLRDECLNTHWFESLEDAKVKLEAWKDDYNACRPHRALDNRSPLEFVAELKNKLARVA